MTYSYNNNDDTSTTNSGPSYSGPTNDGTGTTGIGDNVTGEIIDIITDPDVDLSEAEDTIKEIIGGKINDALENMDWEDHEHIQKILECHGLFQLRNAVKIYDPANVNIEPVQFPNCPDAKEFLYPSGWDYVDYTVGEPTGFTYPDTLRVRLGEIGPPKDLENEVNSPGRINTLPHRAKKWITTEPKHLLWVHPYLENAVEDVPDEVDSFVSSTRGTPRGLWDNIEEAVPISFSFLTTMKKWQSGKISNSPNDFDIYNYAGFHTSPGGKDSQDHNSGSINYPATLKYNTKGNGDSVLDGQKWIAIYGYSRGKEGMGYPDEPTEGLEYGVVGLSGWFTTIYNKSAGTSNNCGLKYAYIMGRQDTDADELGANLIEFVDAIGDLGSGQDANGLNIDETQDFGETYSLNDLEDLSGQGQGLFVGEDRKKLIAIIKHFQKKLDFRQDENNFLTYDYGKFVKGRKFRALKDKKLKNDGPTQTVISIFYDVANFLLNQEKGIPESKHVTLISCDKLIDKISRGEELTKLDFFNDFLSKIILGRDDVIDALPRPINHIEVADNPEGYDAQLIKFIYLVTEERLVRKFIQKDGELAAQLSSGFTITMSEFLSGFDGWCEACVNSGGTITHPDMTSAVCARSVIDQMRPEVYQIEELDTYYYEDGEGVFGFDHFYGTPSSAPPVPSQASARQLLPAEPGRLIDVTINGVNRTASEWRGLWATPAPSYSAKPDWTTYYINGTDPETGDPNFLHTYGPFNYDDMELFYHWIFPPNNHELDPRMDYHITFWYANRPDAPSGEWKQGVTTPPKNAGQRSKGFASDRPKGTYFRICFCQWKTTNVVKGPPVREYMYPPGYKVPGKPPYNGTSPHGIWFDVIVTPKVGNPFDHYNDPTKGPCYQTPSDTGELGDLHDYYWKKPVNTLQLQKNNYYKIWSKPSDKQASDGLKERNVPNLQGLYQTSDKALALNPEKDWSFEGEGPDYWKEGWYRSTTLKGSGEQYYRTIFINGDFEDNLIFASYDPSRENQINDWQEDGEPWVEYRKVERDKWIFGPAYWGELHANRPRPNFYDDKWQTKLNLWSNWEYQHMWTQDIDNVPVAEGQRLHLSADRGRGGSGNDAGLIEYTLYDYDVYIPYDYYTFPNTDLFKDEIEKHQAQNKPSFIYLGHIKRDDYNGFVVTVPVDSSLIFHARNTNRLKDSWKNNGEPINIRTRDSENPRDERSGPAYWAFGDYGLVENDRKGFRGYVDFNDAYWANPLNHWNAGVGAGIPVKKGRRYELTPGPNMIYTHRVIWGLNDAESVSPILYNNPQLKNDKILDTPNRVHYSFVDDNDKLLRPVHSNASNPIVVTAEGDVMLFGAFRYDQTDDSNNNPVVDRPTKEQWSRFGEDIDITVRELPDIFGCGYWASEGGHNANTKSDTNSYERPLYSLTDEMKAIVADDIEADPTSPTLQELEGEIKEYVSTEDPSYRENWIRRFSIETGKTYVVVATDRTPPYHLSPRWYDRSLSKTTDPWISGEDATRQQDREFEWIVNANDPFGPGNIYDDEDEFEEWRSENVHRIVEAHREELWYDVFYAGKPRNQWSDRGERLYLELYEVQKLDTLKAQQYWTDWQDDQTSTIKYTVRTANDQLGNPHWTNPLYKLPTDKFLPGHTYKVWVDDDANALGQGKPNPNYMTVFFADKDPNAIQVPAPKDYSLLGAIGDQKVPLEERWKGPNNNMKGKENACKITIPRDKPFVVIGAWHTGDRRTVGFNGQAPGQLEGWHPGGEEITLKFEEIPDENPKGPVYWGDHYSAAKYDVIIDEANDIEDLWGFPDCGRGEDITKARDANTNPAYYTQIYNFGENANEPNIRTGKRYRFVPSTQKGIDDMAEAGLAIPSEYVNSYPYNQRWWYLNNPTFSLDPTKSNYSYFTPGRSSHGFSDYHDIVADSNYMVFGAHSNLDGRLENTWSRNGEPNYLAFEILPEVPISGPGYYAQALDTWNTLTWVTEPHFYHPLNTVPVEEGSNYQVVEGANWTDAQWRNVKVQVIYLIDDYKNNWEVINEHWKKRFDSAYMPIPFEGKHPEDLLIRNAAMQEDFNNPNADIIYEKELFEYFYKLGPIIDLNKTRFPKFKIPEGCNRAYFAIQGWKQLNQFSRDGENLPFEIEKVEYGNIEGPLYWGDNEPLVPGSNPPPEFDNTHFENPLRHVVVTDGKLIKLTKRDDNAMDNYEEIDIYSFNHKNSSNLDPSKLSLANFDLVGTFKKTDTSLTIDPSNPAIIFSARKIAASYNKVNATDWSPKGEPHPFDILETDDLRGPVYYADEDAKWQTPGSAPAQANLPDFSNANKWNDPIQAYRFAKTDGEFELELREKYEKSSLDVWITTELSALKPNPTHGNPNDWTYVGTFPRNSAKGTKLLLPNFNDNSNYRYIVFGAYGFPNASPRTLESWSEWGEPIEIRVIKKEWSKGPGYPAYNKRAGNWLIDVDERRWKWGNPLYPNAQINKKFKAGKTYKFKRIPGMPTHDKEYQIVWSSKLVPTRQSELTYHSMVAPGTFINPDLPKFQEFDVLCPLTGANYLYFSMMDKGSLSTHGNGPVKDWSPDGTPIPYKVKKVWELPPLPPLLGLIIDILLKLLMGLLGVLLYFALVAPLEILIEMTTEHDMNEYDVLRKQLKTFTTDDGRERLGYGYPDDIDYIDMKDQFTSGDNNPVYFNWTADPLVRAWARVMKIRHNGYFLHFANTAKSNTSDDFTKDNWVQLYNVTPTFGRSFVRLSGSNVLDLGYNVRNSKLLRGFRYRNNEIKQRDDEIKRWNSISATGVKILQPCTVPDAVKQQSKWDDRLVWFSPTLGHSYMATKEEWHYTRGGASYKVAQNFATWGTPYTGASNIGPHWRLWNIFNEIGGGFTTTKSFSNDTSCHGQSFEIINGDSTVVWPVDRLTPNVFRPGIEFDLIWPKTVKNADDEAKWQINVMHLNFFTYDEFSEQDNVINNRFNRKLKVTSGNYKMRNSFDKEPSLSTLGQLNKDNTLIHIKMMADEAISRDAVFESLSINIWLGTTGSNPKSFLIANLKPIWEQDR